MGGDGSSDFPVLARAYGDEPVMVMATHWINSGSLAVYREDRNTCIGWNSVWAFEPNEELFAKIKAAHDVGDREASERLWKSAKYLRPATEHR